MLCEFFVQDNFSNGSYMIVKVTTVVLFNSLLGSCVSDCTHWVDGHYQSCETCQGYVSCSNQILYKRRCPPNLVWDDHAKQCLYTSTTCPPLQTTPKTNSNFIFSESKWSFFKRKKFRNSYLVDVLYLLNLLVLIMVHLLSIFSLMYTILFKM